VKLPDGSSRQLEDSASAADLAQAISHGLAKKAVAAEVDGEIRDLARPLADGQTVRILTKDDKEALDVLRHSAAHLMADAIMRVFPQAQLTIGPAVEDGFYYDIYLPEGKITPDDFPRIEAEMVKIAGEKHKFVRRGDEKSESAAYYEKYRTLGGGENKFKRELVEGIQEKGLALTFYEHGQFVDLCRGPHVPDTGWLKHVKLMKVAGSYWRADATREQLVRVYGTAFFTKQDLDDYLAFLEEAKRRDHRVLGEQLELFSFSEDAPGFPFFHAHGQTVWNLLTGYMRSLLRKQGYQEVKTPQILSEQLWHQSGHYDNYLENMFFTKHKLRKDDEPEVIKDNVQEERPLAVKPMNCPGHCLIYKTRLHSYRELPLRIAEMGLVHRRELSGVRHGLFRVQAFTQDDAHHFCTPEQIGPEIKMLIELFKEVYGAFDLHDIHIELSTRPEKSIGSDEMWARAESALKETLDGLGMGYQLNEGDGAFYGPKIDFHIRDSLKRSWQCGTIQLDFSMPERFGLEYVGSDDARHTPVMVHRACYGSVERFLGILIEHYAGAFPTWLAPVQAVVVSISEKSADYANAVARKLMDLGVRAEADNDNVRMQAKIRNASMRKVPFILVVGEKEASDEVVNVRSRDKGELGTMSLETLLAEHGPWSKG
jgi:threonyl-tRNA synthetase